MRDPRARAGSWLRRHAGVRLTTALGAAVVVAAALAGSGLLLVVLLRRSLVGGVDDAAVLRARDIAATVRRDGVDALVIPSPVGVRSVVQILEGRAVVAASADVEGERPLTSLAPGPDQLQVVTTGRLPFDEGDEHRLVALGVLAPDGRQLTVVVAQTLEAVDASINALTTLLAVGVPVLVLLVGGSTFLLTGRALRPVEAIRRRVAGIDASQLGQRVPVPAARDEVGRLAVTMNDMLDRLESAASAQRRFVSDASHELRSPLASVRTTVEVAKVHPEVTSWNDVADVVLEETGRLQSLVTDLLLLARSDERGLQLQRQDVDLDDLVELEADRLRRENRQVDVSVRPVRVHGDRDRLARVLRNLVDNAVRHASTRVGIRLRTEGGWAVVEVWDDGPGVAPEQAERVFERFVRLDESRARAGGGTGLGLPIVRQLVSAHGGDVRFVPTAGPGALVRVRLPLG